VSGSCNTFTLPKTQRLLIIFFGCGYAALGDFAVHSFFTQTTAMAASTAKRSDP
jgi:hypothetical protein